MEPREPRRPGAFFRVALETAGALVLLAAYPLYLLWVQPYSEAGLVRALALFGVVLAGFVAAGALLAALGARLRLAERPRAVAALQAVVALGGYASLALVGLAIWFNSAPLAPPRLRLLAAAVVGLLAVRYLLATPADRGFLATSLVRLGILPIGLVALGLPWVAYAAATDRPTIADRPAFQAAPEARAAAPRRIILVTFDALRARSTSLHRPALATTPNLVRLAARGTTFGQMRASTDHTVFALPVIQSGMYPSRLYVGVGHRSGQLRDRSYTGVAGFLRQAGYRTYYTTMLIEPSILALAPEYDEGSALNRFFSLRHFNTAEFLPLRPAAEWLRRKVVREAGPPDTRDQLRATRATFERAAAYVARPDARSFVWIHVGPPHSPYVDVKFPLPPNPRTKDYPRHAFYPTSPAAHAAVCEAAYERFVRFADFELGRFVDALDATGLARDTLLVVTADHGEEFVVGHHEHGNHQLREAVTHLPLVVAGPGVPAGARVDVPVGHVDVLPTLLSAAFKELPAGLDGRSLLAPPDAARTIFSWGLVGMQIERTADSGHVAAYNGRHKYVRGLPSGEERLYDLTTDPDAVRDVAAASPARTAALGREVSTFLATP